MLMKLLMWLHTFAIWKMTWSGNKIVIGKNLNVYITILIFFAIDYNLHKYIHTHYCMLPSHLHGAVKLPIEAAFVHSNFPSLHKQNCWQISWCQQKNVKCRIPEVKIVILQKNSLAKNCFCQLDTWFLKTWKLTTIYGARLRGSVFRMIFRISAGEFESVEISSGFAWLPLFFSLINAKSTIDFMMLAKKVGK